jgi:hypothetical protein
MEVTMNSTFKARHGQERRRIHHKDTNSAATKRRKGAMERLMEQENLYSKKLHLILGKGKNTTEEEQASMGHINSHLPRIRKEIQILKARCGS